MIDRNLLGQNLFARELFPRGLLESIRELVGDTTGYGYAINEDVSLLATGFIGGIVGIAFAILSSQTNAKASEIDK